MSRQINDTKKLSEGIKYKINNGYDKKKQVQLLYKKKSNNNRIKISNKITIIVYIIMNYLFFHIFSKKQNYEFNLNASKIKLKIKGIGTKQIYYSSAQPDEIYINGNKQYVIQKSYKFDLLENFVELIWNRDITYCSYMFYSLSYITEIDLSDFDTSKVKSMKQMFCLCSSLTSLNISNLDTSQVTDFSFTFYGCSLLTSLDLSNFNTKSATCMNYTFYNCYSLRAINLNNWKTSGVTDMFCLFYNCFSLTSINLSYFDISNVRDIDGMFYNCSSLTSLDLSNFDTSKATMMQFMFYECKSLISLDLSNFDTSKIIDMGYVFYNCYSLTSINLSNWNTKSATSMAFMFYNCKSLSSLNLSTFDVSKITHYESIFYNLINLEYINLKNFKLIKTSSIRHDYSKLFQGVPNNLVVCMKEDHYNAPNNYIVNGLNYISCLIIDCSNNWKLKQKKILIDTNSCIDKCYKDNNYKFEYNGRCYKNCPKGIIDLSKQNKECKCELDKCLTCTSVSLKKGLCTKCNDEYYQMENDVSNMGEYINCYKNINGYYLDRNDTLFKKCYYTCKTCEKEGDNINHNCLKCKPDYSFEISNNNYINCYEKCNNAYYFDNNNNFHCLYNNTCPDDYNKLIIEKMKCVNNCETDDIYKYEYNNICYKELPTYITSYISQENYLENCDITTESQSNSEKIHINNIINKLCMLKDKINETEEEIESEIKIKNLILENLESIFTSGDYNTINLDNGKDEIIRYKNLKVTLTTSVNQKNNLYRIHNNQTKIDLGKYEILLRINNNITDDKVIYLKTIEVLEEGMKIPKIEFDAYSNLNGGKLVKLEKPKSTNTRIDIFIPMNISENIDMLNSSSGYYNDICYQSKSEYGTDMTLNDRRILFIENNKTICQEDCFPSDYDYNLKIIKCSCKINENNFIDSIINMNINKTKLFENFKNIKNIANLNLLNCYKKLFTKNGILYNIGFFVSIPIIIFHIISIFIFFYNQFDKLINIIKDITFGIEHYNLIKQKKINFKRNKQKIINNSK